MLLETKNNKIKKTFLFQLVATNYISYTIVANYNNYIDIFLKNVKNNNYSEN